MLTLDWQDLMGGDLDVSIIFTGYQLSNRIEANLEVMRQLEDDMTDEQLESHPVYCGLRAENMLLDEFLDAAIGAMNDAGADAAEWPCAMFYPEGSICDLDVSQNAKDNVSFDFSGWPYHVSL